MNYTVCIRENNGHFTATAPLLPDCQSQGGTREEALDRLRKQIAEAAAHTEFAVLQIPSPQAARRDVNPWVTTAGMFEDDLLYQEMLGNVAAYRRELGGGE